MLNRFKSNIVQEIVILLLLAGLTGCNGSDNTQQANPTTATIKGTYSSESGPYAAYVASTTPGVTVKADFTRYHIAGQPYGIWSVNATWRNQDRNAIAEVTVPVTIDAATGQGTALLPPAFLNTVFQDAHDRYQKDGDTSTWFHRPGLYLNFIPDGVSMQYYAFK
jgi:hypothetical protein